MEVNLAICYILVCLVGSILAIFAIAVEHKLDYLKSSVDTLEKKVMQLEEKAIRK